MFTVEDSPPTRCGQRVNPISVVVPCHRVIGTDGSLTGYGGGIARKEWLLQHEGATFRGAEERWTRCRSLNPPQKKSACPFQAGASLRQLTRPQPQLLMNASRSGLMMSAWVDAMPWGRPL